MTASTEFSLPSDIARSITREDLAALPIEQYRGNVCLVETPGDFERAMEELRREPFVGFDTEARPSFRKNELHPPCLIQAATAQSVFLFRLREESDFQVPGELIAESRTLKVGIGLVDDIKALKRLHVFEEQNMLDLGDVAKRSGLGQSGLRNLAGIFLKIRIPKGAQMSNWAAPQLSASQIAYAATDAWICRQLFLRFREIGIIPTDAKAPSVELG